MRQEKKNEFVRNYVEQFKGNNYESYAEREDIANACFEAMKWVEENWIEDVISVLKGMVIGYDYGKYPEFPPTLFDDIRKAMMED